ncbi:unnamed protein product [Mesocestoides corti]|uniref:Cadherin_C_2 domain-containing protein n=1 Tax=Mesocestoides corti TaxID=53468 RepID=A0A0R3UCF9_MESCO|nr:unnamed protein product [Mesocestoides corti]
MKIRLSIQATDSGLPPRSSTLNLLVSLDPSLAPTSTLASMDGSAPPSGQNDYPDSLTNIYLIIVITFGVSIAFAILVVAICFMSRGQHWQNCCRGSVGTKEHETKSGNSIGFYTKGDSQLPDHSNTMTFSNGDDYLTTTGTTSYGLEKEMQVSTMTPLSMNAFFDQPFMKPICNPSMVTPGEDSVHSEHRTTNDAASVATFDRFSSLGRLTNSGYPPLSPCLVNGGYHEAYFAHANRFPDTQATGGVVYSWCETPNQTPQTFSPAHANAWASW